MMVIGDPAGGIPVRSENGRNFRIDNVAFVLFVLVIFCRTIPYNPINDMRKSRMRNVVQ